MINENVLTTRRSTPNTIVSPQIKKRGYQISKEFVAIEVGRLYCNEHRHHNEVIVKVQVGDGSSLHVPLGLYL